MEFDPVGARPRVGHEESKETPLNLVMQYLHDAGYTGALKELEGESGEVFEPESISMGGRLLSILEEHRAMKDFADLSLEDREEAESLLNPGDGIYVKEALKTFDNLHPSNVLALRFSPDPESSLLATGSTDKTVKISDYNTGAEKFVFRNHNGPVLSLDFNPKKPSLLLSSAMDGGICMYDVGRGEVLHKFPNHTKYAVRVKWSPDGTFFATASYDKTVRLYKYDEGSNTYSLAQTLSFLANPEAIVFTLDSRQLIVAVREDNYLQFIDVASFERTKVNMNSNGDNHVSFSALDVVVSPDGKYLLVSTDKDRLILFKIGSSEHVRTFYGASNDTYSQPRCCFSPSGKYVYSTSQDNKIYVWDLATQKIVARLPGHNALVRDIHIQPHEELLGSASFDKTVILWQ